MNIRVKHSDLCLCATLCRVRTRNRMKCDKCDTFNVKTFTGTPLQHLIFHRMALRTVSANINHWQYHINEITVF